MMALYLACEGASWKAVYRWVSGILDEWVSDIKGIQIQAAAFAKNPFTEGLWSF